MLPYLKPRKQVGVIIRERQPDGDSKESGMEGQEDEGLMLCAEDLLRAIGNKDAKEVAIALRAAFDILESQPHVEGEHLEEEGEDE